MPVNAAVTNSGKISLQETTIKIFVFTLASSRLNSKIYLFHLGFHGLLRYLLLSGHKKKIKMDWL